jgi:hypothetical protein
MQQRATAAQEAGQEARSHKNSAEFALLEAHEAVQSSAADVSAADTQLLASMDKHAEETAEIIDESTEETAESNDKPAEQTAESNDKPAEETAEILDAQHGEPGYNNQYFV